MYMEFQMYVLSFIGGIIIATIIVRWYYAEQALKHSIKDVIDMSIIESDMVQLRGMVPLLRRLLRDMETITGDLKDKVDISGDIERQEDKELELEKNKGKSI